MPNPVYTLVRSKKPKLVNDIFIKRGQQFVAKVYGGTGHEDAQQLALRMAASAAMYASLAELLDSPNAKQSAMWDRARAALGLAFTGESSVAAGQQALLENMSTGGPGSAAEHASLPPADPMLYGLAITPLGHQLRYELQNVSLAAMQKAVGGYIAYYRMQIDGRDYTLVVDEEGLLKRDRGAFSLRGRTIQGPAILFANDGSNADEPLSNLWDRDPLLVSILKGGIEWL